MRSRRCRPVLWLLAVVFSFVGSADGGSGVEVEYNKSTDFRLYKTFAWAPFQTPAQNAANHVRITTAVERELLAKGLRKADPPETADVLLHYEGYLEKGFEGTASRSESPWQPNNPRFVVDFGRVQVGTLVLDIWDAQAKDVVWHAKGREKVGKPDEVEQQINHLVRTLLARYPPKAKGG